MTVVFVHGWSVRSTQTYGFLPQYLQQQIQAGLDIGPYPHLTRDRRTRQTGESIGHIHLGKYVSFDDAITLDDLARAFESALQQQFGDPQTRPPIACITHSTGGPIVRQWLDRYHRGQPDRSPIRHLIMLAPPNHGSALAQLGKGRLSRIRSFFHGVEPGTGLLDWLEPGSEGSWHLNERWLREPLAGSGFYPFVLQGQTIDHALYDTLNAYTGEMGSDGVVRLAAANLNYQWLEFQQRGDRLIWTDTRTAPRSAMAVLPDQAHSGARKGILQSIRAANAADHPTTQAVLQCLRVRDEADYAAVVTAFDRLSQVTQNQERERTRPARGALNPFTRTFRTDRCTMLIFRIRDDTGAAISDYDLRLLAGPHQSDQALPPGFFVDRQANSRHHGTLTYYLNHDVLKAGLQTPALQNRLGFEITARPARGLIRYGTARFDGNHQDFVGALQPNQTLRIDVTLERRIDRQTFTLTPNLTTSERISDTPSGEVVSPAWPLS